ncbi:MAG: tetratricopeptide repeat protein, partial [Proteobacteria bacterium]|nr:tetratricopeptide repeat protein [Pseudomonadota bacterium]
MKMRKIILFFLTVLVLSINLACGPRAAVKPSQVITGEEEFSKAEELYEKGDHGQALEKYLDYVEMFPRTSFTPAAFMKIGSLYKEAGQNESARNIYKKLINDFPGSEFALDAQIEILATLMIEQKYTQLLQWAVTISQKNFSRVQKLRILMMTAESYLATGERIDAAVDFFKAHGIATPLEKETVTGKIKESLEGLSDMEIQTLISRLKNPDDVNMV